MAVFVLKKVVEQKGPSEVTERNSSYGRVV